MADNDEDMGTSFMRQHMSEAQPSLEAGGFANAPRRKLPDATDESLTQHYGKDVDGGPDDGPEPSINRSRKGAKAPGSIGNSKDKPIKVLR
jgi:hypothetical protein